MTEQKPLTTTPLPVRLRVEDYLLLDRSGAFEGYGKTELIGGEVFYMNAQHRPHARAKIEMYDALRAALLTLGSQLRPMVEVTIAMPPQDAPEPDIVLTSEPDGEGPVPLESVALVVEIADTTLVSDLGLKAEVYAAHGVPEYWVVDLRGGVVHQMWQPTNEGYAARLESQIGKPILAVTVAGLKVTPAHP